MNTVNAAAIFFFKGALLGIELAMIIHQADISWKKGWGGGNMILLCVCFAGIGSNKALCTAAFHCLYCTSYSFNFFFFRDCYRTSQ